MKTIKCDRGIASLKKANFFWYIKRKHIYIKMTENTAQSPHVSTRRGVKNAAEKQKFSFLYIFLLQICTLVLYILFPTIYICNICMHIPRAKLVLLRVNKKYIYYEIFSCADALTKRM